ncbi:MAG TPA: CehA/McbA family metallohydrolase [bacterium]|nr:CehA/McbA family metallohydrolase [bacterium]
MLKFTSAPAEEKPAPVRDGMKEFRGALHVHTFYPADKGSIEKLARTANALGLDFVLVSDHNSLAALQGGKEGMYGKTLVLIGDEVSTDEGHLLVCGISRPIKGTASRYVVEQIRRQEGVVFIAHPFAKDYRWKNWSFGDFDGIEIYNTQANMLDEDFLSLAVKGVALFPDEFYRSIIKISPDALARWDRLLMKRKTVGIGSTDAHESHGLPGMEIDSYQVMLKTINCHVIARELSKAQVVEALRAGRLFFSFDIFADPSGFAFYVKRGERTFHMGDTLKAQPGDTLCVSVNRKTYVKVVHNGRPIHEAETDRIEIPLRGPGFYRVEVYVNRRPWIFSNPIYVELSDETDKAALSR